jgi:hypothetical protein
VGSPRRTDHAAPLRPGVLLRDGEGLQAPVLMTMQLPPARAPPGRIFQTSGRRTRRSRILVPSSFGPRLSGSGPYNALGRAGSHRTARPSHCAFSALRGTVGSASMTTPGAAGTLWTTRTTPLCSAHRFPHRVGAPISTQALALLRFAPPDALSSIPTAPPLCAVRHLVAAYTNGRGNNSRPVDYL